MSYREFLIVYHKKSVTKSHAADFVALRYTHGKMCDIDKFSQIFYTCK